MLLYCGKEVCNVTNCGFVPPGGSRIVPAGDGGCKGGGGFAVGMHVSFLDFLLCHFQFQSTDASHLFLVQTPPSLIKLLQGCRPTHEGCEVGVFCGRDGRSESSTVW